MKAVPTIHLGRKLIRTTLVAALVLALAVVGTVGLSAMMGTGAAADSGAATLQYHVFPPGPLPPDDPVVVLPPNIAMAKENGHTVEVVGSGTIAVHPKSASGDGTFIHRDADGNVVAQGTWEALNLLSYHSFGSSELDFLPPGSEAGRAKIRVRLTEPTLGLEADAILTVTCLLPDVKTPPGFDEGIELNVQGLLNFNKTVSGGTLFIRE